MNTGTGNPRSHGSRRAEFFPALRRWGLDRRQTALLFGVLLVTLLVYLRCLGNGWVYDDHPRIVHNPQIANWSYLWESFAHQSWWFHKSAPPVTLKTVHQNTSALAGLPHAWTVKKKFLFNTHPATGGGQYYRPLHNVWEGVNYHLFGTNPIGWHLDDIFLHLAVVLLVFRAAQLLTESTGAGLVAAMLFGVLGVHAEPVVWASAIPEPLSTFFQLAAFCLFIPAYRARARWRRLVLPLVMLALATLSHEMAVVFPLLIAAYVFLFPRPGTDSGAPATPEAKRPPIARRIGAALGWSAPFFGVSALYLGARAIALGAGDVFGALHRMVVPHFARNMLVFRASLLNHSFAQILATVPTVLVWYLKLLALPWLAGPGHGVRFVTAPHFSNFYLPVAILTAIAIVGFTLFRKSPRRNLYLFCAVWWIVTLAPALSLNQIVALVQDRYVYMPSFAFCVLLADWFSQLARTRMATARAVAVGAAAVIILVNAAALWRVEPVWRSDLAMWADCAKAAPDSLRCHSALAGTLLSRGDLKGALQQDLIAEKLAPKDPEVSLSLGIIYMRMGRAKDANQQLASYYLKAFRIRKQHHQQPIVIKLK